MKPRFTKYTKHENAYVLHARVSEEFKLWYEVPANAAFFQQLIEEPDYALIHWEPEP
jgi:hypothetical protein